MSLRREITEDEIYIDRDTSKEEGEQEDPLSTENKTVLDILERVGKGRLSASAAMSMVKSMGQMTRHIRNAILAQDVIGRELRRTRGKTIELDAVRGTSEDEELDYILNPVRGNVRGNLLDLLDQDGDGLFTQQDLDRLVQLFLDGNLDLDGDGDTDADDWQRLNEMIAEYGGIDEVEEGDEGDEEDGEWDSPDESIDRDGDGVITQSEWNLWMSKWRDGNVNRADLNGDGVVDAADQEIARQMGEQFGEDGLDMGEWEGPLPMEDPGLNKLVGVLYYNVIDEGTQLTAQAAVQMAGDLTKVVGVGSGLVTFLKQALRRAGKLADDDGKYSAPTTLTGDAGGGGVPGGQPGSGGG